MSQYYDHRAKKISNDIKYESKLFKKKNVKTKQSSENKLPKINDRNETKLRNDWRKIIEMTEKEGVI